MAVSRLEIFQTEITPVKNAKIEQLDLYLDDTTLCTKTYDNDTYQYQKIRLDTEMKVSIDQENYNGVSIGNYMRLTQDGRKYYFFINKVDWISNQACKISCSIDTINTFVDELEWSDKTIIEREHEDRFKKVSLDVDKSFFFFSRPVPGGQEQRYTIIDEHLKETTIENITYEVIPIEGSGRVERLQVISFDDTKGELVVSVRIYAYGDARAVFRGNVRFLVKYADAVRRKIDVVPEDINPDLYGKDVGTIENQNDNESWYVVYNSDKETAIKTLLCKDNSFKALVNSGQTNIVSYTASEVEPNRYYFLDPMMGTGEYHGGNWMSYWLGSSSTQTITDNFNNLVMTTSTRQSDYYPDKTLDIVGFVFYKSSSGIQCDKITFLATQKQTIVEHIRIVDSISIKSDKKFKIFKSDVNPTLEAYKDNVNLYTIYINSPVDAHETSTKELKTIGGFEEIDRTKTTLVKIVKLPYCPINYNINTNGEYEFDYNIVLSSKQNNGLNADLLELSNTIKFDANIDTTIDDPLKPAYENLNLDINVNAPKNIKYESKLYNSEFYQPKFIYDSFGLPFDLEKIDNEATFSEKFQIDFIPSRLFNSSMMFRFPEYATKDLDTQNFNNVLIANRNNEMPIFNNAYMNYIRTGYNFDVKNKKREDIISGIKFAGEVAQFAWIMKTFGITAAAKKGYSSNYAAGIIRTLSAATSAASTAASGANALSQMQNSKENIEKKLQETAMQGTSITDADSVDLLDAYAGNKAKIKLYQPNQNIKEYLFDLFYYNGYTRNIQKIPNTNSRYWFNYIQCQPVFQGKNISVYNNYLDDIYERYNNGITVYHYHANQPSHWDFHQEKENWETNLVG